MPLAGAMGFLLVLHEVLTCNQSFMQSCFARIGIDNSIARWTS